MKNTILLITTTIACFCCLRGQNIHVDERFELTGVVFRLTGIGVFQQEEPQTYLSEIDKEFSKYRNHELIKFVKKTVESKYDFPFNFICDLAADIEITSDGILFTDRWLTYYDDYRCFDGEEYWTKEEMEEYLRLLNKFYKDTRFRKFFFSHKEYYEITENNFKEIANQIDKDWFSSFFGKPLEMENIWISPVLGHHNFALSRNDSNGRKFNNCIIGCSHVDSLGNPIFGRAHFNVLVHEICHNYNNPICDKYKDDFREICDTIEKYIGSLLTINRYAGAENILYEGMNRVCEYSYYKEDTIYYNDILDFNMLVNAEEIKGFIWLDEILRYMDVFSRNRKMYKTFEDFFPELKSFMQNVADNMKDYYLPKLHSKTPVVLATFPANNSIVDTNLSEIVVYFSKPMCVQGCMTGITDEIDDNETSYPIDYDKDCMQWKDAYTHIIKLNHKLIPHTLYGFYLRCGAVDDKTHTCCKYYKLIFKTK